ncbi:MAG: sigma-70 family RNA polymerase sigma factor [Byssovorax sp.]
MPVEAIDPIRGSFRAIFDAELDFVVATLRQLGVAPRDLEDLAHEVFLRVYKHWHEYQPSRPLRPWLFVFAYRQASDYRRLARHRREVLGAPDDTGSGGPGADELLAGRDQRALVDAALREVDLDRRAVVLLHDLQETPMAEVAAMLEIPVATAYSRLRVGREELVKAARRLQRERGEA